MPYKSGKLKGKLTTAEIRKLVRAHNKLSKITIPPGSDRDTIINIIAKSGFRVNHEQQRLEQTSKKDITLDKAKEATKIVPKTEAQKQQAKEKKEKKKKAVKSREGELIKAGAIIGKARAKAQMKKEKSKPKPKEDEVRPKEKVGRPKIDPNKIKVIEPKKESVKSKQLAIRKNTANILKDNGFTTLTEYKANIKKLRGDTILSELPLKQRKVIVEYVEKVNKELKSRTPIDTSKKLFANAVGNVEREFGFLADKIEAGKVNVSDYKFKGLAKNIDVEPAKKGDLKSQIKEELTKVRNKYKGDLPGGLKENKYMDEGNNPLLIMKITKQGDRFKTITAIKSEKLLLDFVNEEFKNVPVVFDNLIFSTNNYDPEGTGKQIPVTLVYQGKVMKGKGNAPAEKEDKGFKVEARERSQMINALSLEMKKKINPYKVLGITRATETPALVKQRCRELRLKEHPDKGGDPVKFDLIQKVCKILLDTQTLTKN